MVRARAWARARCEIAKDARAADVIADMIAQALTGFRIAQALTGFRIAQALTGCRIARAVRTPGRPLTRCRPGRMPARMTG